MMILSALFLGTLMLAQTAGAEGARLSFTCRDDAGQRYDFVFAPVALDASGAGRVEVGDNAVQGYAGGTAGPWSWTRDDIARTLIVDGGMSEGGLPMLLHRLDTATAPITATRTDLSCEAPF